MPMTAGELELLDLNNDLMRDMRDSINAGADLNQLLTPILLEEAGYSVTRATEDVFNPQYQAAVDLRSSSQNRIQSNFDAFVNFNDGGEATLSSIGRNLTGALRREVDQLINEYNQSGRDLNSLSQYSQRTGDIIGLERMADPQEDLRESIETQLLERQQAALRGELPVNPALLSDLEDQEEQLRDSLLQNLGSGYETSTPGIEALAEFNERKSQILEGARRDDMGFAQQLSTQMGQFIQGVGGQRFATAGGVLNNQFGAGQAFGNAANAAMGPLNFMQNNRMLDFQMGQANNAPGLLESLFAQGAGTAMTFGLADLFDV